MFGSTFRGAEGGGMSATASNAASSSSQQQQQRRMHPIRPLTIKQLLEAQSVGDGVMIVDGREVTQATVIGCVMDYENAPMAAGGALTAKHYGYRITDHTGYLTVRQWIDADSTQEPLPRFTHVRASGTVKLWKDTLIVTGTVVAVADSNEMNYHMLDAILTHLRLTQGDKLPPAGPAAAAATASSLSQPSPSGAAASPYGRLPAGAAAGEELRLTDLLVNFIKQHSHGDVGMSMDELVASSQRYGFGMTDVRNAMRTLAAEGRVYQTHDNRFNV